MIGTFSKVPIVLRAINQHSINYLASWSNGVPINLLLRRYSDTGVVKQIYIAFLPSMFLNVNMKRKKLNPIDAIHDVYGLFNTKGYAGFVIQGGAPEMMRKTWVGLGMRLNNSSVKLITNECKKKAA